MATQQTIVPLRGTLARTTWSFGSWATSLTVVALVGLSLVSIVYLSLASSKAGLSFRLQETTREIKQLEWIKGEKLRDLSRATDPALLEKTARARGFGKPSEVLYVNWHAPAPQPVTERTPPTMGPGTPVAATDWWEALINNFLAWISEPPPAARP